MAKRGRPRMLDGYKRREILAILSVGGTREVAARYVGCTVRTIVNAAARDADFAERLRQNEGSAEIFYLENIRKAAQQEKYWRAAAWALERLQPERYARRSPDAVTIDQIRRLMAQLAEIIVEEVPAKYRKNVLKRLNAVFGGIADNAKKRTTDDET
jgi:hypothetical protein